MTCRYARTVLFTGGLLAGMLALASPAVSENPMTPLRPVETPKSAGRTAPPSAPAGTVEPAPAAVATRLPSSSSAAPPAPDAAPASVPGEAVAAADRDPTPRARRSSRRDRAAGGVKPGRWEFTARLQTSPAGAAPIAASAIPGQQPVPGGMPTTYATCVESDNAVPADLGPQCRLERHARRGPQISWSMSCSNTGVRAEGRAQYRGDTMTATVVSHLPGHNGATTDLTQHITGRHLGACRDIAQMHPAGIALPPGSAMPPAGATAAVSTPGQPAATEAASSAAGTAGVAPPPSPSAAPRPTVAREEATSERTEAASGAAPTERDEARQSRRSRSGRHAHRHHHRHHHARRSYRSWSGRAANFGPNPYSGSGP